MTTRVRLGGALAVSGRDAEAEAAMAPAIQRALDPSCEARTRASVLGFAAGCYVTMGMKDRAAELEAAITGPPK